MSGAAKDFDIGVLLTATTGKLLCPFADFHSFAEHLTGGPVWTHEFALEGFSERIRDAVLRQHPDLPTEMGNVDKDNWRKRVADAEEQYGCAREVDPDLSLCRTCDPLETLQEVAGDKPVIVIEAEGGAS